MAIEQTKAAKHGRNRALGVRTWLGAGALTVGVGAALVGAAAVAQADTGDHPSAGSPSTSKHEAGPKRTAGVASSKRVAPSAKVNKAPVSAGQTASPAAAAQARAKAAAVASSQTQTTTTGFDTPFGPVKLDISATIPDVGDSGPVSLNVNASTPVGPAQFSLNGQETYTAGPPTSVGLALTGGSLHVPDTVAFLVGAAGTFLAGGLAAQDSATAFLSALQSGNLGKALVVFATAGPAFTHAVLFGTDTLTVQVPTGATGPAVELHIPVSGILAPLRPLSASWSDYSMVDPATGDEFNLAGGSIEFAGTKFGGAAGGFGQLIGLL